MFYKKAHLILSAIAIALLLLAPEIQAQIERVSLRVDGLACPFCAYGLEKKLTTLNGFEEKTYEVKINEGKVLFDWHDDKPLNLVGIESAVGKAGFTLRNIHITVSGKIVREDEGYFLVLPEPLKQRFILYEPQEVKEVNSQGLHAHEGLISVFSNDLLQRLDKLMKKSQPVRIIGLVHRHKVEQNGKSVLLTLGIEGLEN